jgi:hypothetical protein
MASGDATRSISSFVNRAHELAIFDTAYASVHSAAVPSDPTDLASGRRNALVFYGIGGIGKTRLSKRCQLLAESKRNDCLPVTFRIDLADPAFLDPEALVLSIRAALGNAGVQCRAFDIALAAYWGSKHPGEDLHAFLDRSNWIARISRNNELSSQISDSLDDLLTLTGPAYAGIRIGSRFIAQLTRSARTRRLLEYCPRLEEMLQSQDLDKLRTFLPYLLSWDISQDKSPSRFAFTVFVDTFEEAQERARSKGDLEDVLARMIFLMPNSLFVITGRNRLQWADESTEGLLLFQGQDRWPTLSPTEGLGSQFLLGSLDEADARLLLEDRLAGSSASQTMIESVVMTANGWPLYLELQAGRILRAASRDAAISTADLGDDLTEVVVRILRDLDYWERDLLRAASLVPWVDQELLQAALPQMRRSRIAGFLKLSLVAPGAGGHGLHPALRGSVLEADRKLMDSWSDDEWRGAASRVLACLALRAGSDNVSALAPSFISAIDLASRFGLAPTWIAGAAERLYSRGAWEVLRSPSEASRTAPSPIRAFVAAAIAAGRRATGDRVGASQAAMEAEALVDALPEELRDYVHWQAAASSERGGDWAAASRFCGLIRTPRFKARAIVRTGRLSWIQDDLPAADRAARIALAQAESNGGDSAELASIDPVSVTARNLLGWTCFTRGDFKKSHNHFLEALSAGREAGSPFFESSELSHLALVEAIYLGDSASPRIQEAIQAAEHVGAVRQLAQARVAETLLAPRGAGARSAVRALESLRENLVATGEVIEARLPLLAEALVCRRNDDYTGASRAYDMLSAMSRSHSAFSAFVVIASWLSNRPLDSALRQPVWGVRADQVRRRWLAVAGADEQL